MKNKIFKILKIAIPVGVGVYLTWFFLSGLSEEEMQQTKDSFSVANYGWVAASILLAWLSHAIRAYRSLYLLEPMGYTPKLSNVYHALMSGYVINYTIPRSGELARAGLLAGSEKIPVEKGFGTIVVERVFDLIMLGVVTLSVPLLLSEKEMAAFQAVKDKAGEQGGESNLMFYLLIAIGVIAVLGAIAYFLIPAIKKKANEMLAGLWEGLKSVWTMKKKWAFLLQTLLIWVCYVFNFWTCLWAFPETAYLGIGPVLACFVAGAIAVTATPGGLGLYPWMVAGVLEGFGIKYAAFGIFMWVVQTALLVVLGLLSLFLIQRRISLTKSDNG